MEEFSAADISMAVEGERFGFRDMAVLGVLLRREMAFRVAAETLLGSACGEDEEGLLAVGARRSGVPALTGWA